MMQVQKVGLVFPAWSCGEGGLAPHIVTVTGCRGGHGTGNIAMFCLSFILDVDGFPQLNWFGLENIVCGTHR